MSEVKRLLSAQFITLLIHGLLLLMPLGQKSDKTESELNQTQVIKIKTLGRKKSKMKDFAITNVENQSRQARSPKLPKPTQANPKPDQNFSLEDLAAKDSPIPKRKITKKTRTKKQQKKLRLTQSVKIKDFTNDIGSIARQISERSSVGIKMILPDGVSMDELNKEEYRFFIFQQRTLQEYIHSVLNTYRDHRVQNPHRPLIQEGRSEKLLARVTFDKSGNIVRIQIVESSPREHVEKYWFNVLNDMKLPNPPKMILTEDETFSFFFRLNIY